MKRKFLVGLAIGYLMFGLVGLANATTMANYSVQGYNDDYAIWIGVGNVSAPDWVQQVAWTANGNWPETAGSIAVPDNFVWDKTWWLKAVDGWAWDSGNIINFSLDTAFGTYISPNLPVYIPDLAVRYAYIEMPEYPGNVVPEPSTMLLLGFGLVGLAGVARKKMKK